MKRPVAPPPLDQLLEKHKQRLPDVLKRGAQPTVDGDYIHWDKLRRKAPRPGDLSPGEWWTGIRLARFSQSRPLPLRDTRGRPFLYMLPDRVHEALHRIDSGASGRIGVAETVTNPASRERFVIDSLIREAITSSQLEGASTTRAAAAKMIRAGRRPRNRSERMIANNYQAMRDVREIKDQPLTAEAVLALHRAVTDGTLDDPAAAGRLQLPAEDRVEVCDIILRALDALDRYLRVKAAQAARIDRMLRNRTDLNHRQLALLAHAVRHPDWEYTTRSHMTSHAVVYATARADLFRLAELSLLDRQKRGRKLNVFRAPPDLEARIRRLRSVH